MSMMTMMITCHHTLTQLMFNQPFSVTITVPGHQNVKLGWRCGVAVSVIRCMNEVNQRQARLVLVRVTIFGQVCTG